MPRARLVRERQENPPAPMDSRKPRPADPSALAEGQAAENSASPAPSMRPRRLGRPREVPSLALIKESTKAKYYETYKDIFEPGALDRKTKELIAIAAAAVSGCQGCLVGHIRKAKALGATMDEIKESVGVAFSVGAASVVDNSDVAAALLNLPEE